MRSDSSLRFFYYVVFALIVTNNTLDIQELLLPSLQDINAETYLRPYGQK